MTTEMTYSLATEIQYYLLCIIFFQRERERHCMRSHSNLAGDNDPCSSGKCRVELRYLYLYRG